MKIAVAQNRPQVGPVEQNLAQHEALIEIACQHGAKLLVFPELSLTGYEPRRAAELARSAKDPCFDRFQAISNRDQISVGVGVPIRGNGRPTITMLVFHPDAAPFVYSKMHLHDDELPYFAAGPQTPGIIQAEQAIALAICYELSVPEHAENAARAGANVYVASVAKTARGVATAHERLAHVARDHSMPVLMANCLGFLDGAECTGNSAAWDQDGNLLAQLDDQHEGIVVFDTDTQVAETAYIRA